MGIPNVPPPVLSTVKLTNKDLDDLRANYPAYADGYNSRAGTLVYFYNRFGREKSRFRSMSSGFAARRNRHLGAAAMHALKVECWNALKTDNAEELCKVLIKAAGSKAMVPSVMEQLEIGLWNKTEQMKMRAQKSTPKGLVCVAATNHAGIPEEGAVGCLEMLLTVFPDGCSPSEINRALERLQKRGLDRPRVRELLLAGPYNSNAADDKWRSARTQWAGLALLQRILSANPRRYAQHIEAAAGLQPGVTAKDGSRATRLIVNVCRQRITAALEPVQKFLESRQNKQKCAVVDGEEFVCIWRSPGGAGSEDAGYLFDPEKIPALARTRSRVLFCSPTASGVPSRWCVSKPETEPIQLLRNGGTMSGHEPLTLERVSQIWDASSDDVLQHLTKTAKRPFNSTLSSALYAAVWNEKGVHIDLTNRFSTWDKSIDDPIDVYIGGATGTTNPDPAATLAQPDSGGDARPGAPKIVENAGQALPFTAVTEHKELTEIWCSKLGVVTLMIGGSPSRCRCLTHEDLFCFAHQVCMCACVVVILRRSFGILFSK